MRKKQIDNLASHIERLTALRDLAEISADSTPAEIQKLNRNIREARQEIIDLLDTSEVKQLAKRALRPEQAGEIVEDEPVAKLSSDFKKAAAEVWNAQFSKLTFHVATKGAAPLDPAHPITDATTGDRLEKFKFAPAQPNVPRVTPTDAYLNHLSRRPQ